MKIADIFIDENGTRRIVARKTIELEFNGRILKTIPAGTIGGVIDKTVEIKEGSIVWVDQDSAIEGKIKIEGTIVLLESSYLYNFNEDYINYNGNIYIKNSRIIDTIIDGSTHVYINNSLTRNTKIKNSDNIFIRRLSKCIIYESELIGFFDIDSCRITDSIVANIRLRPVYDVYCCDNVDWSFIQNSSIYSEYKSTIKLAYGNKIIKSKINICLGNLCFDRYNLINANIHKASEIVTISGLGSRDDITLFYKAKINNKYKILVRCGCFDGDIDEFEDRVKSTYPNVNSKFRKQYLHAIVIAKETIELDDN